MNERTNGRANGEVVKI